MANIIVAGGNFHGRTTTIISFSDDESARADFGPFTPGFRTVPYGDAAALEAAIDENTVAVLLEPIQGEAGIVVPPAGLPARRARDHHAEHNVLFIADEIQSGLGRTGATFACEHDGVVPDLYLLGKALGGGIVPVSAVVGNADVLGVLRPGEHGSTFGGNPLAAAVGLAVVNMLATGEIPAAGRASSARTCTTRLLGLVGHGVRRGARRGPLGRHRHRPGAGQRPRGLRGADGARRAGQGHPRLDHPARPAAGGVGRGPGLGGRPARRRARGVRRRVTRRSTRPALRPGGAGPRSGRRCA